MNTPVTTRSRTATRSGRHVPAYGPVDAVLSFVVFYVFVERATPTVVDVLFGVLDVAPSAIGFGLAALLWFVLAVTAIDQVRRQFAALGVGSREDVARAHRGRATPSEPQALAYVALLLVGGLVAYWTFEPAVRSGIDLIQFAATLDSAVFVPVDVVLMVVFFVAFAAATKSLDRLTIGAVRTLLNP